MPPPPLRTALLLVRFPRVRRSPAVLAFTGLGLRGWLALALGILSAAQPWAATTPARPSAASSDPTPEQVWRQLYADAQALFSQLPAPIREQFDFPTPAQWFDFAQRFQRALEGDSLADFAALAADARTALLTLRQIDGYEGLADWLEQRLDEFEGAQQALRPAPPTEWPPRVLPPVPHYDLWLARVRQRPAPPAAATLVPRLQEIFRSEGVPPELVWVAEAESSFNRLARSPVGARGLFQFMPVTARSLGLSTTLPDERLDPEKSARAAARYLRQLHGRFGNWALALAAYNAGEGRVSRTLQSRNARSFTAIADALPAETRMYVPKVCALIATRAGVTPHQIPPPRG